MTDPKTALQELSARGITTLEQLAESNARRRKPQRIDSEKALQDILARSAPPDPSFKSKIGPPASSVAIVLDGKRVEYNAVARLNGQPLDYVATTLKGGEQALVGGDAGADEGDLVIGTTAQRLRSANRELFAVAVEHRVGAAGGA